MRPSRSVLPICVLTAALTLGACGGSSAGEGPGNGAGGPTLTGPASSAATAVPSTTTAVPTPDAAQSAELLGALAAIDPNLSVGADAVSNAVSLCVALQDGDDAATAVGATFPDADLDGTQQQAVVTAVTSSFCTTAAATGSAGGSGGAGAGVSPSAG